MAAPRRGDEADRVVALEVRARSEQAEFAAEGEDGIAHDLLDGDCSRLLAHAITKDVQRLAVELANDGGREAPRGVKAQAHGRASVRIQLLDNVADREVLIDGLPRPHLKAV